MTYVTCRLTAKNRDELRNPTFGNQVWAAFSFFIPCQSEASIGVLLRSVVKVDRRIRWHYTTTILRLRIGARLTRYEIVNFAISLALSAGTLMASAGNERKVSFDPWDVTKGRLRGGGGGGRRRRRRCGGGAKSQPPPSFHLIQLSSPQRVHNALQIV